MGINIVILEGNLGADVRFNKTTANQKSVANFRMATNSSWTDAAGTKMEKAEWHNVVCWNKLAETVGQYMRKGSRVLVEGRNQTREYEVVAQQQCVDANGNVLINPQTQQPYTVNVKEKRYTTEIVAKSVKFLDKAPDTQAYPAAAAGAVPANVPATGNTQFVVAGVNPAAGVVIPAATVVPAIEGGAPLVQPVGVAAPGTVVPVVIPGV
jgi:single-strand DNA-binding protein